MMVYMKMGPDNYLIRDSFSFASCDLDHDNHVGGSRLYEAPYSLITPGGSIRRDPTVTGVSFSLVRSDLNRDNL